MSAGVIAASSAVLTWQQAITALLSSLGTPDYLWWRLNDTTGTSAVDSSGNGRTGTRSGSTITTGQTGALLDGDTDKAMLFSGTNPVIQTPYVATWDTTQWSVCCWFKTTTTAAANILVARDHQSGGRRFQLQMNATGQLLSFSNNIGGMTPGATTPLGYNDGNWHFCTLVYDQTLGSSQRHKIYVDNSSTPKNANGSANNFTFSGTAVPFSVANATRTTQAPFLGTLDEVLYFPTKSLTGAQHQALYQAGMAL